MAYVELCPANTFIYVASPLSYNSNPVNDCNGLDRHPSCMFVLIVRTMHKNNRHDIVVEYRTISAAMCATKIRDIRFILINFWGNGYY